MPGAFAAAATDDRLLSVLEKECRDNNDRNGDEQSYDELSNHFEPSRRGKGEEVRENSSTRPERSHFTQTQNHGSPLPQFTGYHQSHWSASVVILNSGQPNLRIYA